MFGGMFGRGGGTASGRSAKRRVEIQKIDPAKCGCDDQYQVVALDDRGKIVKVFGSEIRGYTVAKNIKELAEAGRI